MSDPDANKIDKDWTELDQEVSGLSTGKKHIINVKREAIPLVFVPGIMGSVLRLSGTDGAGDNPEGLPNLRWNPGSKTYMLKNYFDIDAAARRRLLIGENYSSDFLEVHNTDPVGNGFQGVSSSSYLEFLQFLQQPNQFGPLDKIFDFPVYAVGYNWTDSNANNGAKLATRIDEIIEESKTTTGQCEKVILISHSMGGLVTRYASEVAGANSKILGIIHGVQPAAGAAAAYWRIKAGFEGFGPTSPVLGNSGKNVTVMLGNMPGGLELLPNKTYRGRNGRKEWLIVKDDDDKEVVALPKSDPYAEIYRVPGTGDETLNSGSKYWGLVDAELLNPGVVAEVANDRDSVAADADDDTSWSLYLSYLGQAQKFHDDLGVKVHPNTYAFHGIGHDSADSIFMEIESVWVERNSYPKRGFRGRFNDSKGEKWRAFLQDPSGDGDGTVSTFSGSSLDQYTSAPPVALAVEAEHEPAYNNGDAREFSVTAITALCEKHYKEKMGK